MLAPERRTRLDKGLFFLAWSIGVVITIFGVFLKAPSDRLPVGLLWFQDRAWVVVAFGPLLLAIVVWSRRKWGNPWAWQAIQTILNEFRQEVFGDLTTPLDHHRVTLFKYHKYSHAWRHPLDWSGWLIAVARSNHLTKRRIHRFRAPDDAEACEGVVGKAWRHGYKGWIRVPAVKNNPLPVLCTSSDPTQIKQYAYDTGVSPDWVKEQLQKNRPLAASYTALLVLLKGQPWGVLVLDSRDEESINSDSLKQFTVYATLMTPLLERA